MDALDPSEVPIHVEYQNPGATELEVIADARRGHIEEMADRRFWFVGSGVRN